MKNPFIAILLAALNLGIASCRKLPADSGYRLMRAELSVRPAGLSAATRTTDETALHDLNWWLCDTNGEVLRHGFQTTTTLRFECMPGKYRLRIAANMGEDLGEDDPSGRYLACEYQYDALPMIYDGPIVVNAAADDIVRLPPVGVERCVAKISYEVEALPDDLELLALQPCSVPFETWLFDPDTALSVEPDDYTDMPVLSLSGRRSAGDLYMLPNNQGILTSIADQRDKNAANAPRCATYLLIRARRGGKVVSYTIYPGENNTSDFNIRSNRHYRLRISLVSDDTADTRISTRTLLAYDDWDETAIGGWCVYEAGRKLYVETDYENGAPSEIEARLRLTQGDAAAFGFEGRYSASEHRFEIGRNVGTESFAFDYNPQLFTEGNSVLGYSLSFTDSFGYTQEYACEHKMANVIYVYAGAGGSVTGRECLHVEEQAADDGPRTAVLCYDSGCRLVATPAAGYRFDGWYSDAEGTDLRSSSISYKYLPVQKVAKLYARFKPSDRMLDTGGTANCYIAPYLNTLYSFDATVMGNGKATPNISPRKLAGVRAEVLWETGAVRGAVIRRAEYRDGRIYIETGPTRGNALIGLFDAAGKCIWSWHIWAVSYFPSNRNHTYASGCVFMDRNLGALSDGTTNDPSFRGLYYQWGRKDPFLYPASATTTSERTPAVHADGYEFSAIYPMDHVPAEVMTIAWATAHPTTFIWNAYYTDWEEESDIQDWLYESEPGLWGNRTTASTISTYTVKSIYDPCPPGWRVPAIEEFGTPNMTVYSPPDKVSIRYDGTNTAYYPLGDRFNGTSFPRNGVTAVVATASPYVYRNGRKYYERYSRSVFSISSSGVLRAQDFRHIAMPVRCIRE